ncbi:hypothetical protein OIE62_17405 [Streptomyces scopuliridis]|uniref:Uncharacterized protein n=1 Tax=Streptomyces scopuliridis TaxID=452529 RepID=A0ACD4ZMK8_9ACTN|nr:hypothetical protein [Streptomyces scopuliridis]WSB99680.1 hypothetical protein OG835_23550 [Streptomyces scopuliridis]WSC06621.1 hypothetical protein OIE62_17405 [Streptomyces scopuliridis]
MTVSPQDPALEPFDDEQFEQEVYELVRDTAPRLFAVVVEYRAGTKDADAAVVAWGLADESGGAEVIQMESGCRWRLAAPDHITRYFGRAEDCSPRLVWLASPGVDGDVHDRAA